jgi:hypothetical protein
MVVDVEKAHFGFLFHSEDLWIEEVGLAYDLGFNHVVCFVVDDDGHRSDLDSDDFLSGVAGVEDGEDNALLLHVKQLC